jgi:apolipoprotein D and lipocalin family protein
MGASTRFTASEFAGDWQVHSRFGSGTGGVFRVSQGEGPTELRITSDGSAAISGVYSVGIPGELISVTEGREALIVMWVDEDFETAAIGTASGSYGALIDRDGVVPPDRAQAARQVLTFYGWDVTRLSEV